MYDFFDTLISKLYSDFFKSEANKNSEDVLINMQR